MQKPQKMKKCIQPADRSAPGFAAHEFLLAKGVDQHGANAFGNAIEAGHGGGAPQ